MYNTKCKYHFIYYVLVCTPIHVSAEAKSRHDLQKREEQVNVIYMYPEQTPNTYAYVLIVYVYYVHTLKQLDGFSSSSFSCLNTRMD